MAMEREREKEEQKKMQRLRSSHKIKKLLVNSKAERVARGYQGTKSPNKKIEK